MFLCFHRLSKFATVCKTSRILENAMGTTTMKTKCSVFKLPKDESDKQTSLNVLPQRNSFQINPAKFFICERPKHSPSVKLPGGYSRPSLQSSVFNRPISCGGGGGN